MIVKCYQELGDEGERAFEKSVMFEDVRQERLLDCLNFFEQYNYMSAH